MKLNKVKIIYLTELKIATDIGAFATEIFAFATKKCWSVPNLWLGWGQSIGH